MNGHELNQTQLRQVRGEIAAALLKIVSQRDDCTVDVAMLKVVDEIKRCEQPAAVETPVDRKPDEDAFRARMTGAAIRLVESAEMADETLRFWLQQSSRLKEIRAALSHFEGEMRYVEFETSEAYHTYQSLMKTLRAVIEKEEQDAKQTDA